MTGSQVTGSHVTGSHVTGNKMADHGTTKAWSTAHLYYSRGSSIQFYTTEIDELAVGREFADFVRLSATILNVKKKLHVFFRRDS